MKIGKARKIILRRIAWIEQTALAPGKPDDGHRHRGQAEVAALRVAIEALDAVAAAAPSKKKSRTDQPCGTMKALDVKCDELVPHQDAQR